MCQLESMHFGRMYVYILHSTTNFGIASQAYRILSIFFHSLLLSHITLCLEIDIFWGGGGGGGAPQSVGERNDKKQFA